jgi:hypothetical protein
MIMSGAQFRPEQLPLLLCTQFIQRLPQHTLGNFLRSKEQESSASTAQAESSRDKRIQQGFLPIRSLKSTSFRFPFVNES